MKVRYLVEKGKFLERGDYLKHCYSCIAEALLWLVIVSLCVGVKCHRHLECFRVIQLYLLESPKNQSQKVGRKLRFCKKTRFCVESQILNLGVQFQFLLDRKDIQSL